MQVQKITFTPTFKTQQIKKYNQNISNPIQDNSRLDNIDYSKIAFGSIYNVKPKKLNIELEKTKLLRQINELLNTKEKGTMTNNDISLETIYRRIIGIFRANENLQEKILYKMMDLRDSEELSGLEKYEELIKFEQSLRKKTSTLKKPEKQPDEKIDYQLLNKFKTAITEDNFNLKKVFTDYYKELNNIQTIEELNKKFPKIKTPKRPEDIVAKKIEEVLTRDFYEGMKENIHSTGDVLNYIDEPLTLIIKGVAAQKKLDVVPFFEKIAEPITLQVLNRYKSIQQNGFSSIPEIRKNKLPQISDLDIKLLFSNFDDFVLSSIRKHYLNFEKFNEMNYSESGAQIKLSELKNSDYKFEKMSDKIKQFIKTASSIESAQKDYEHFDIPEFKNRLNTFANSELGNNEYILKNIIDFDDCNFTPEDKKSLIKFLRSLDDVKDGKKDIKALEHEVKTNEFTPHGTKKLNELERQQNEQKLKQAQKRISEQNDIKNNFDRAINLLYMNNLTDIANTCSKYRPTSLEDSHNGKFLTKLINENINPKTKQLNTEQLEKHISRWDTFNYYSQNKNQNQEVLSKAIKFATNHDSSIDIDKAGQYLMNAEIVKLYPESKDFYKNSEILSKIMDKTNSKDEAIKYLCKFDKYNDLAPEEKKELSKFADFFDSKDPIEKSILKTIVEQDYLPSDTVIKTKTSTASNEEISATLASKAKKQIADKYKYPLCLNYLRNFEEALRNYACDWGTSGIKRTGKNNNTLKYKMELKISGEDDRLFSSNNDYYFDVFSDKGFH